MRTKIDIEFNEKKKKNVFIRFTLKKKSKHRGHVLKPGRVRSKRKLW